MVGKVLDFGIAYLNATYNIKNVLIIYLSPQRNSKKIKMLVQV